ncbi:MAG TPA: enoyl-CoA hydratase [Acidimicrobiales bacterium]|nr:enoyl-CoA hydratase [Acidimicrobiales bacterium]
MTDVLLAEVREGVAVLTLNRPESRNALNSDLLRALPLAMTRADEDDSVRVIVLTGADPAFCAGLDLRELGSTGDNLRGGATPSERGLAVPWPSISKPVIGAVNGAAVTGGFELALQCDFLVASERARFGDTHARVGLVPAWGLSVLLPQAVGVRYAKEISLTGNFVDADEACRIGLVNRVVPHERLMMTVLEIAADIVANDRAAVQAVLGGYRAVAATTTDAGLRVEADLARSWNAGSGKFDPAEVERRRQSVIERGRSQVKP